MLLRVQTWGSDALEWLKGTTHCCCECSCCIWCKPVMWTINHLDVQLTKDDQGCVQSRKTIPQTPESHVGSFYLPLRLTCIDTSRDWDGYSDQDFQLQSWEVQQNFKQREGSNPASDSGSRHSSTWEMLSLKPMKRKLRNLLTLSYAIICYHCAYQTYLKKKKNKLGHGSEQPFSQKKDIIPEPLLHVSGVKGPLHPKMKELSPCSQS